MKIPITKPLFDENEFNNIKKCLESGWVAQGRMVENFEHKVAEHEGVEFAVAVTSCTTALHLALIAYGIGEGQDVIVPSFTFVATANAVQYTKAETIFCDIDIDTFNISLQSIKNIIRYQYNWDSSSKILRNKLTGNKLTTIIPVHLFGLCADMEKINEIANQYNIIVIEDAACALGAKIGNFHQGMFGNTSCVSFHPRKCITTGEGGMILTNNIKISNRVKELRSHAAKISEVNRDKKNGFLLPKFEEIGYNYRMSDIQASLGIAQVEKLDYILEKRREKALYYNEKLKTVSWIKIPIELKGYYHTYQSYVCLIIDDYMEEEELFHFRNRIMLYLEKNNIQTRQGTHAVHMLDYYKQKYRFRDKDFKNACIADKHSISLPLYATITKEEQDYVIKHLLESYQIAKGEKEIYV